MSSQSGDQMISCALCSFSSLSQAEVLAHTKRDHERGEEVIKFVSSGDNDDTDTNSCLASCAYCPFLSYSKDGLENHTRLDHPERMPKSVSHSTSLRVTRDDAVYVPVTSDDSVEKNVLEKEMVPGISIADEERRKLSDHRKTNDTISSSDLYDKEIETVNCLLCSYSNVSPDNVKSHIFSQHPTKSTVALKIHGSESTLTFFCVKETCEYSTTVCKSYEKHLIVCLNVNERLSDELKKRLDSSIGFILDYHTRHGLETNSEFEDFATSFTGFYKSVDPHSTSSTGSSKETHLNTQIQSTSDSESQNPIEVNSENRNICYDQVSMSENNEINMIMNINESSHFAVTSTNVCENIIPNSCELKKDIGNELSPNTNSDFMEAEEIMNSGVDAIVQNTPSPPTRQKTKRNLKDNQKKCSSIGKQKSSNTAGRRSDSKRGKANKDKKEKLEEKCEKTSRSRGNIRKVGPKSKVSKDSDRMTKRHGYGQNRVSAAVSSERDTRISTSDAHHVAPLHCWLCFQSFSRGSELKTHTLQEHSEILYAIIEGFNVQAPLLLFCPKDCEYFTSQEESLTHHMATCRGKELPKNKRDKLDIYNFISQEYIQLKQKISSRAIFDRIERLRASPPESQNKRKRKQDIACTEDVDNDGDDFDDDLKYDFNEIFQGNSNARDLASSSHQHAQTSRKNTNASVPDGKDFFSCHLCDSPFSSRALLESHLQALHYRVHVRPNGPNKNLFNEGKISLSNVGDPVNMSTQEGNQLNEESGEMKYECMECGHKFKWGSNYRRHMRIHTGEKPYRCVECDRGFSDKKGLKRHSRTHTGEKPYQCPHCDSAFGRQSNLIQHMSTHTDEKPYECTVCGRAFKTKTTLSGHMRVHTGEKPFKCEECDRSFAKMNSFNRHMRTHSGEKPYQCKQCSAAFSRKYYLDEHMRKTHTGEMPFKCEKCDQSFYTRIDFNTHMRIHTGELPYICEQCGQAFYSKGNITSHMKIHSNLKRYKCEECSRTFNTKIRLTSHVIRIHNRHDVYMYQCQQCDRAFNDKLRFSVHMRKHTGERPFQCHQCGMTFRARQTLLGHVKLHTDKKPFQCKECGRGFNRKTNLNLHMSIHTGEKPFKCEECGRAFRIKKFLVDHMKIHTSEKPYKSVRNVVGHLAPKDYMMSYENLHW